MKRNVHKGYLFDLLCFVRKGISFSQDILLRMTE